MGERNRRLRMLIVRGLFHRCTAEEESAPSSPIVNISTAPSLIRSRDLHSSSPHERKTSHSPTVRPAGQCDGGRLIVRMDVKINMVTGPRLF